LALAGLLILAISMTCFAFNDEGASLAIQFVDGQARFHVGEVIAIELAFTASVPDTYQMTTANYDRSGRLNIEQFHVTPTGRDPLHNYYAEGAFIGGGLSSWRVLSAKPETIKEELNEWIALDKPGHYTVYVTSDRVSRMGAPNTQPVVLESNSLEFDVVEADTAWQAQQLSSAVLVLDDDAAKPEQRAGALRRLRFMDTPASVEELVRQLGKHASDGCWDCAAGLAGSLHQDLAVQTLEQQMRAPDVAITQQYLSILLKLRFQLDHGVGPPYPEHDEKQQKVWQESMRVRNDQVGQLEDTLYERAAALAPSKQAGARAETVRTLLLRPMRGPGNFGPAPLPADEVAAAFDALPPDEQWTLLSVFWGRLKLSAMIDPLQRLTGQPVIPHQLLRDVALQRLYELDQQGGRARILEEIANPHIDDGAFKVKGKTLGLLPDETLAQFDDLLAGRLAKKDSRTMDLDAQLIGRYATGAVLARVRAVYDRAPSRRDCAIEDGLVLYFLRVQPDYGVQRLANAPSFCMTNSLPAAIRMGRWSDVEPSIIAALNQTDLNRARLAAERLGRYGSAKAKAALWVRMRGFHEQWAGRESELVNRANMRRDQLDAMGFQFGLVEALGRAQAWLLTEEEVTELEKLTVGQERENVRQWHRKSPIDVNLSGWLDGHIQGSIQQYGVQDVETLRKKLAQYEIGTRFVLSSSGSDEQLSVALRAVREVAAEHGLIEEGGRQQ
jgi:hypothetical protein